MPPPFAPPPYWRWEEEEDEDGEASPPSPHPLPPMEDGEEPQLYSNSNHVILKASLIKHFLTVILRLAEAILQISEE